MINRLGCSTKNIQHGVILSLFAATFLGAALPAFSATLNLTCIGEQGLRSVVASGSTMTVYNPKTPNIKIEKQARDISKPGFTAFENDAWKIIFDTSKKTGSLTNKTFGDQYLCGQN